MTGRSKFKDDRRMNRFGTDILVKLDSRQINFKNIGILIFLIYYFKSSF